MANILLFGLTGGIASGKSSIAKRWRQRGIPVIDADAVSRKVVEKGTIGLSDVVSGFGDEFLSEDGTLDRRKLGNFVFANPESLRRLESIVWPHIDAEVKRACAMFQSEGHLIACYEAAIIVDQGHADRFRPLVTVHAPVEERIRRMMKRDGHTEEQALQRLKAQVSDEVRNEAADYLISSDRPKEETVRVADAVFEHICKSRKIDADRYSS